jgi:hypothetical protein
MGGIKYSLRPRTLHRLCRLWVLCACVMSPPAWSAGVRRAECFPVETSSPELRERFKAQLLAALDSEYLYTLIGGLKPMTDGGLRAHIGLMYRYPDLGGLRELQALTKLWSCGEDLYMDVVVSWMDSPRPQDGGKRRATLLLVNRPAFGRVVDRKQDVFGPYGFTAASNPSVVYYAAWNSRNNMGRMQGYLYGFPDHAVEWYASVGPELSRMSQPEVIEWLKKNSREISIPLFESPLPGAYAFRYSVPQTTEPAKEDVQLQARADAILNEYRARRARYIGPGKPGILALIRDWYDDGSGHCSPANTMQVGLR